MNGKWMERLGQARMWIFCGAVGAGVGGGVVGWCGDDGEKVRNDFVSVPGPLGA
jgi:hypothetical protein